MAAPPTPEHFSILFPLSRSRLQHHCWSLSSGCFSTQSSKQETETSANPCRQQLRRSRHSTSRHGSKTASGLSGRGRPRNRGHLPPPQVVGTRFTVVVLGFQSKSKTPFPQPCSPGCPVLGSQHCLVALAVPSRPTGFEV